MTAFGSDARTLAFAIEPGVSVAQRDCHAPSTADALS
jgi:hypothetical protein